MKTVQKTTNGYKIFKKMGKRCPWDTFEFPLFAGTGIHCAKNLAISIVPKPQNGIQHNTGMKNISNLGIKS
jgi:hypothetical protein